VASATAFCFGVSGREFGGREPHEIIKQAHKSKVYRINISKKSRKYKSINIKLLSGGARR
jgi:hypothetical protein